MVSLVREWKFLVFTAILFTSIRAFADSKEEESMSFSLHYECDGSGCPMYILARGRIGPSAARDFEAFYWQVGYQPLVYFDSLGGDLLSALRLGRSIRKLGLTTYVGGPYIELVDQQTRTLATTARCYSACVFAFVGGITRQVRDQGQIGVHQFRGGDGDVGEKSAQFALAELGTYLEEMGVDRRLLDAASATDPDRVFLVPHALLQALNVDNSTPPKSPWQLKADDSGRLFLLVKQRQAYRDATTDLAIVREGSRYVAYLKYQIRQTFRSEKDMTEIFSGRTRFLVRTSSGATFEADTLSDWLVKSGGFYVAIGLSARAISEISKSTSFELHADWANAIRDVNPSTDFGTEGFRNGAAALSRQ